MRKFEELVKIVCNIVPDGEWDKVKDLIPEVRREFIVPDSMSKYMGEFAYREFMIFREGDKFVSYHRGGTKFKGHKITVDCYVRNDQKFERWQDKNLKFYLWELSDLIEYINELHSEVANG